MATCKGEVQCFRKSGTHAVQLRVNFKKVSWLTTPRRGITTNRQIPAWPTIGTLASSGYSRNDQVFGSRRGKLDPPKNGRPSLTWFCFHKRKRKVSDTLLPDISFYQRLAPNFVKPSCTVNFFRSKFLQDKFYSHYISNEAFQILHPDNSSFSHANRKVSDHFRRVVRD